MSLRGMTRGMAMGNSLREQLLKAGLASKKLVRTVESQERVKAHKQRKDAAAGLVSNEETPEELAERQLAEQRARNEAFQRHQEEQRRKKELQAQVRDLITNHRVQMGKGEFPYNFTKDGKVQRLYVDDEQRLQLGRGALAIVFYDGKFHLVPADTAAKIEERDASAIAVWHEPSEDDIAEDDPYAAYKVPDDLVW